MCHDPTTTKIILEITLSCSKTSHKTTPKCFETTLSYLKEKCKVLFYDVLSNFFMDATASPKMKTTEGEGVEVHFLTPNTVNE